MSLSSLAWPLAAAAAAVLLGLATCVWGFLELKRRRDTQFWALVHDPHYFVTGSAYRCPWHPWQLCAVVVLLIDMVIFYGIEAPALHAELDSTIWRALTIAHITVAVISMLLFIWLQVHDPASCAPRGDRDKLPPPCWCTHCEVSYIGVQRRHCWSCNKCVIGFDHHCRYLNQCIGASNYRQWITCITCMTMTIGVQFGLSIYGLMTCMYGPTDTRLYKHVAQVWGVSLWCVMSIMGAVVQGVWSLFLSHLTYFHAKMSIWSAWTGEKTSTLSWWGKNYDGQESFDLLERVLFRWLLASSSVKQTEREATMRSAVVRIKTQCKLAARQARWQAVQDGLERSGWIRRISGQMLTFAGVEPEIIHMSGGAHSGSRLAQASGMKIGGSVDFSVLLSGSGGPRGVAWQSRAGMYASPSESQTRSMSADIEKQLAGTYTYPPDRRGAGGWEPVDDVT